MERRLAESAAAMHQQPGNSGSAHADTYSTDARGAYQTECEFLLHGDVSTLDMTEYQARWNECLGEVKKADISCEPGMAHHRANDRES